MDWGSPADDAELQALEGVLQQCFAIPRLPWTSWYDRVGRERIRVVREQGRVVAGLGVYALAQFWGGESVPMGGVAGVGVAAEARGGGLARAMMTETLRELRAEGVPLSALYASTATLYRTVGYEQAGTKITWEAPLASLPRGRHDLPVRAVDPRESVRFAPLYTARARRWNGHLDRPPAIWSRIAEPYDDVAYGYTIGGEDETVAYLVHTQKPLHQNHHEVVVRDMAWSTRAGADRLIALLSDLRSLGDTVVWTGVASDPLVSLLPEQTARVRAHERWMLRIVDVPRALSMRGFPPVDGEVHLDVMDELLPDNAGRWLLRVRAGRAEVERGGHGDVTLDVAALAPLYTGFASPPVLRAREDLRCEDVALAHLSAIFAGPEPWLCDHF